MSRNPRHQPRPRAAVTVASAAEFGTTGPSWGCRQRFASPRHFAFNAYTVLGLASCLIALESFQYLYCYVGRLQCLILYSDPASALLHGCGLVVGIYLLLPGVLCLLAADGRERRLRWPRARPGQPRPRPDPLLAAAGLASAVGAGLTLLLLACAVAEVAQYASLVVNYIDEASTAASIAAVASATVASDSAAAATEPAVGQQRGGRLRLGVGLIACLAGITADGVAFAFLAMQASVACAAPKPTSAAGAADQERRGLFEDDTRGWDEEEAEPVGPTKV